MLQFSAAVVHYKGAEEGGAVEIRAGDGVWVRVSNSTFDYAFAVVLGVHLDPDMVKKPALDVVWLGSLARRPTSVASELKVFCWAHLGAREDDQLVVVNDSTDHCLVDLDCVASGRFEPMFAGESLIGKPDPNERPLVVIRGFFITLEQDGTIMHSVRYLTDAAFSRGHAAAFDFFASHPRFVSTLPADLAAIKAKGVPVARNLPVVDLRASSVAGMYGCVATGCLPVPSSSGVSTARQDSPPSRKRAAPVPDPAEAETPPTVSAPKRKASPADRWLGTVAAIEENGGVSNLDEAVAMMCHRAGYVDLGGLGAGQWAVREGQAFAEVHTSFAFVSLRRALAQALVRSNAKAMSATYNVKVCLPPSLAAEVMGPWCRFEAVTTGRTGLAAGAVYVPQTRGPLTKARLDVMGLGRSLGLDDEALGGIQKGLIITTQRPGDEARKTLARPKTLRRTAPDEVAQVTYDCLSGCLTLRIHASVSTYIHGTDGGAIDLCRLLQ